MGLLVGPLVGALIKYLGDLKTHRSCWCAADRYTQTKKKGGYLHFDTVGCHSQSEIGDTFIFRMNIYIQLKAASVVYSILGFIWTFVLYAVLP